MPTILRPARPIPRRRRFLPPSKVAAATSYTFTGPSAGYAGQASTNFTVTPNGTSSVTITPATDGTGTFDPVTVTFDGTAAAKTFTYTPSTTTGTPHTLSVSNSGSLANPASLDYAVLANYGQVEISNAAKYGLTISNAAKYGLEISNALPNGETPEMYDIGDVIVFSASFLTAPGGTSADPTTITLRVMHPTGSVSVYTYSGGDIVKDSTGHYHYDYTVQHDGDVVAKWEGTGAVVAAEEETATVRESVFDLAD